MLTYQTRLPRHPRDGQPLLIMLHGRGASEADMLALARYFQDVLFVAPRAPFAAADLGYNGGYAWYRYLGAGAPDPEHFEHSQQALHAFIHHIKGELPVRPGNLVLGGFSQGGTMSMGYALRHPGAVKTVLNLSGFLPEHPSVRVTPDTVAATCFYWPHGLNDQAVPFALAEKGRARLLAANACLIAPDYAIEHDIVPEEIDDILEILHNF
ncbi:MAG: hypothetical protein D6775_12485 [Caldilineae bacterium]|nr:MAG: hypothetical protein D6775_12485 [Caldilineae bacterium]